MKSDIFTTISQEVKEVLDLTWFLMEVKAGMTGLDVGLDLTLRQ